MCGIVGIAGNLSLKDENAMKRMLLADYFRGPDSTGLAAVRALDNRIHVAKVADHPIILFDQGRFKAALNGNLSSVFIGHNRYATKGKVNNANAHPFEVDHIVGVHNGTLDWASEKFLSEELNEEFDVDSKALITGIARIGVKETIQNVRGAWSIVYYDSSDGTLNFLRNDERPMWYAFSEEFDKLFYASEWELIMGAASPSGTVLYKDKQGMMFFSTQSDTHYSIAVDELINNKDSGSIPKFKSFELKGKEATAVSYQSPFGKGGDTGTGTGENKGKENKPKPTAPYSVYGTDEKPYGDLLPKVVFDKVARDGCTWCHDEIEFGDQGIVYYPDYDVILCNSPECSGHSVTRIYADVANFNQGD